MASLVIAIGYATYVGIKTVKEKKEKQRMEDAQAAAIYRAYHPESASSSVYSQDGGVGDMKAKKEGFREKAARKLHVGGKNKKKEEEVLGKNQEFESSRRSSNCSTLVGGA